MNKTISKIKLKILSPLHIGSDDTLTSVGEYVIKDGKVKIIDQDRLFDLLQENNLYNDYIDFIAEENNQANVLDFFNKNDLSGKLSYSKEMDYNFSSDFDVTGNNLLELAIETAGQKYIPGSTLKGAFRSMLFTKYILENDEVKQKIEDIIDEEYNHKTDKEGNDIKAYRRLNNIKNKVKKIEASEPVNVFYKQFRLVDSELFQNSDIQVEQARRVNFFKKAEGEVDVLRETIKPEAETEFEIHLNNQFDEFENEPFKDFNIDKLFQIINEIQAKFIEFEIALLQQSKLPKLAKVKDDLIKTLQGYLENTKNTKGKTALLRLGKGKTLFFQTVLSVLSEEARNQVIELIIKEEDDINEFPKTRVLNGHNEMFGWVELALTGTSQINSTELEKEIKKQSKPVLTMKDNKVEVTQGTEIIAYNIDSRTARFLINGQEFTAQLIKPHKKIMYEEDEELQVRIQQIKKETKEIKQIKVI